MRCVAAEVDGWLGAGHRVVLATVVATRRSAPRPIGSHLAVCETGATAGAVSGGCVEAAVRDVALEVLAGGPARVVTYGAALDDIDVGLPCDGEVDVHVAPLHLADWTAIRRRLGSARPFAIRTPLDDAPRTGASGSSAPGDGGRAPRRLTDLAATDRRSGVETDPDGRRIFVEVVGVRPRLVVVGADDLAAALCAQAAMLDWSTVAVDARDAWATPGRLPAAGRIVVGWPGVVLSELALDAQSAVVVATHEPRFDVPALVAAVRSPAFYVGALGSRGSAVARRSRLIAAGLGDAEIDRISGPTGLDVGAETPAETAMSIVAEVQAVRRGRAGGRLTDGIGPIHGDAGVGRRARVGAAQPEVPGRPFLSGPRT